MALKTLPAKRDPITLEDLGARIDRSRAEFGEIEILRNSGKNRTPSKGALLKAIKDAAGKW